MKRIVLCMILAAIILFGFGAAAEQPEYTVLVVTKTFTAADDPAQNMAENYINSLFYGSKQSGRRKAPAATAGLRLTEKAATLYGALAGEIPKIASGERTSTVFTVPMEDGLPVSDISI